MFYALNVGRGFATAKSKTNQDKKMVSMPSMSGGAL